MNRSFFSFVFSAALFLLGSPFLTSTVEAAAARPKLVMLIAEPEYKTAETLPKFAAQFLEKDFNVVVVTGSTAAGETSFDHIEALKTADVLLVSVKRRSPPREQMQVIKDYIMAGHPVVGIRTASHAFVLRGAKPKETEQDWPTWDADIFGGGYTNHYAEGPAPTITAALPNSPLLRGVNVPFVSKTKLYKVSPLKPNAQAVLMGAIPDHPAEPVAYTAKHIGGGRAFYTSLGGPSDFEDPAFQRLLVNALKWSIDKSQP
jgi:type 1 glutamine amidotransferase